MTTEYRRRALLLTTILPTLAIGTTSSTSRAAEMGILAPSYYGLAGDSDPSAWSNLESNWPTNGSNSMIIVNPDSGAGPTRDDTLWWNMAALENDDNYQPHFLGYVDLPESHDAQGNPTYGFDVSDKMAEIDRWFGWYGMMLMGYFFDDLARENSGSQSFDLGKIEAVITYMEDQYNPPIVVLNAAGPYSTTAGLFYCIGNIVAAHGGQLVVVTMETYENRFRSGVANDINTHGADFAPGGALNWVYGYPASSFAGLVHDGTAGQVLADLQTIASYNIGVGFVTDQLESVNPWSPGPSAGVWTSLGSDTGSGISWTFPGGNSGGLSIACPPPG
jgi:spherulation-specific family 4 protein